MNLDSSSKAPLALQRSAVASPVNPARFIGRVGVLAAALGIGAFSVGIGVAAADAGTNEDSSAPVAGASRSAQQAPAGRRAAGGDKSRQPVTRTPNES